MEITCSRSSQSTCHDSHTSRPRSKNHEDGEGMDASRVQKRLLHLLAQAGEGHINERLVAEVPTPQLGDVCHPAKK